MTTGSSKIKSILLKYKTDKPVRKTPYQVKGVIMRQFPNEEIVPMLNGQYWKKFLYPRIQVKVFNEEILLVGLNQGVDPILKLQMIMSLIFFQDLKEGINTSENYGKLWLYASNCLNYSFYFLSPHP